MWAKTATRFARDGLLPPLLPAIVGNHWFEPATAAYLGAAMIGIVLAFCRLRTRNTSRSKGTGPSLQCCRPGSALQM